MPRVRRADAVSATEASDYRSLYEDAASQLNATLQELEASRRQIEVLQEDYNDALSKNSEFVARLNALEEQMDRQAAGDPIELEGDIIRCVLDGTKGEVKTTIGRGGSVEKYREGWINGQHFKYACDEPVEMPRDHAIILGAL